MTRINAPFERGTTRSGTERPHLLGMRCYFPDETEPTGGNGVTKVNSGMEVEAVVVKNNSGGTLAPKSVVTWEAGYEGTQVDSLAGSLDRGAGVVDPFLDSAVADGEQFLLIVKGPTTVLAHDGSLTAGTGLITAAAGRADGIAADGDSDDALAYFGTAKVASAAQDDDVSAVVDFRF